MSMSYGEVSAITDAWEQWKHDGHGSDAGSAWDFIDSECDMYSEGEKEEIHTLIGCIEESE